MAQGSSVAVAPNGDVLLLGTFIGPFSLLDEPPPPDNDPTVKTFLARFDPRGKLLWSKQVGAGKAEEMAIGLTLATSASGDAVVGGYSQGPIVLKDDIIVQGQEGFISSYNADGNRRWSQTFEGQVGQITAVAVDASGAVFAAGNDLGILDYSPDRPTATVPGAFITKLTAYGQSIFTTRLYTQLYQAPPNIHSIALSPSGEVVFSGDFTSVLTMGVMSFQAQSGVDAFIAKISGAAGQPGWLRQIQATFGHADVLAVAVGADENIYATGHYEGDELTFPASPSARPAAHRCSSPSSTPTATRPTAGSSTTPGSSAPAARSPSIQRARWCSPGISSGRSSSMISRSGAPPTAVRSWRAWRCPSLRIGGSDHDPAKPVTRVHRARNLPPAHRLRGRAADISPWSRLLPSEAGQSLSAMALDSRGEPAVAGSLQVDIDATATPPSGVDQGVFLSMLSDTGTGLWSAMAQGQATRSRGVAVAPNGDVLLLGWYADALRLGGAVLNTPADPSQTRSFLARFDASGKLLWSRTLDGEPTMSVVTGTSLATTADGDAVIGGTSRGRPSPTTLPMARWSRGSSSASTPAGTACGTRPSRARFAGSSLSPPTRAALSSPREASSRASPSMARNSYPQGRARSSPSSPRRESRSSPRG